MEDNNARIYVDKLLGEKLEDRKVEIDELLTIEDNNYNKHNYRIVGFIVEGFLHYKSCVYENDDRKWYEYNDKIVRSCNVDRDKYDVVYLLFYEKIINN